MRKVKKLTRGREIKRLDGVFSKYIRQKYADDNGIVTCVTCGGSLHWKEAHCGHYVPRGCLLTRFEETNVAPQCCGCNTYRGGEQGKFTIYLIDKHGREEVDRLHELESKWKREGRWIRTPEIRELYLEYKQLLNQ